MRINVLGAGAFGSALAVSLAHFSGHATTLWAREDKVASGINRQRFNPQYLPEVPLGKGVRATSDIAEIAHCNALLVAVPGQYVRGVLEQAKPHLGEDVWLISCSKGIEADSGLLLSEVMHELFPTNPIAVLSGPAFAAELARGIPTAMMLASTAPCPAASVLAHPTLAILPSDDINGCQIGGAVKNIIAIACGMASGLGYGQNTTAALQTTGLAEMALLNAAKGGQPQTLMSMAGVGDLLLTCGSTQSRNYRLGQALAEGKTLQQVLESQKAIPEGASNAIALQQLTKTLGITLPLCRAIHDVLYEELDGDEAISQFYYPHHSL